MSGMWGISYAPRSVRARQANPAPARAAVFLGAQVLLAIRALVPYVSPSAPVPHPDSVHGHVENAILDVHGHELSMSRELKIPQQLIIWLYVCIGHLRS